MGMTTGTETGTGTTGGGHGPAAASPPKATEAAPAVRIETDGAPAKRPSYRELAARARPDGARAARAAEAARPVLALRYRRLSGREQKEEGLSFPVQDRETGGYAADQAGWDVGPLYEDVLR